MRKAFRAYGRWTDRDFTRTGKPIGPLVPVFAAAPVFWLAGLRPDTDTTLFLIASIPFVLWEIWIIRRAFHVLAIADWKAGRQYERRTRYLLPSEYRDTESASLSARRKRFRLRNG